MTLTRADQAVTPSGATHPACRHERAASNSTEAHGKRCTHCVERQPGCHGSGGGCCWMAAATHVGCESMARATAAAPPHSMSPVGWCSLEAVLGNIPMVHTKTTGQACNRCQCDAHTHCPSHVPHMSSASRAWTLALGLTAPMAFVRHVAELGGLGRGASPLVAVCSCSGAVDCLRVWPAAHVHFKKAATGLPSRVVHPPPPAAPGLRTTAIRPSMAGIQRGAAAQHVPVTLPRPVTPLPVPRSGREGPAGSRKQPVNPLVTACTRPMPLACIVSAGSCPAG